MQYEFSYLGRVKVDVLKWGGGLITRASEVSCHALLMQGYA